MDDVQETAKVDEDKETVELQSLMKVIPDEEEVAVDAIPLATKPPSIIDWKILKEGKISYFQIIRADESSKRYSAFIQMLKSFDREDLETLWRLVNAKHGYTRPEEGYERVLWGDLKTLFEPNVEDTVWRNLQENKKKYPLTPATITDMLNKKLQADHWNKMSAEKVLQTYNGTIMPNTDQAFRLNWTSFSTGEKRANNNGGSDLSIFIGDLAPDVTNTLLYEMVAGRYPSVKGAKVVVDTNTGCLNSYGFVRFADDIERIRAMNEMMVSIVQAGLCISVLQLLRSHLLNNSMDKITSFTKSYNSSFMIICLPLNVYALRKGNALRYYFASLLTNDLKVLIVIVEDIASLSSRSK
ncbi:polyadenylate-binding protein RBP47-like protein [Tanacetum coccineum]